MNWSKYRKKAVFTESSHMDPFLNEMYQRIMGECNFDPAQPEHDKTVTSYYDPATGQYFQCDINLDTFKKSEECVLIGDSKYFRFLQAFDVEDAQLI